MFPVWFTMGNFGLFYTLTFKTADRGPSVYREAAVAGAKILIEDITWYASHDNPSFVIVRLVYAHILRKKNAKLSFVSTSVSQKEVNTSRNGTMELVVEQCTEMPLIIFVGF